MVLLEFKDPHLRDDMKGLEATWRSSLAPRYTPTEISSPNFHRWLTLKFATYAEAAAYTAALGKKVRDRSGAPMEVIHKGAKAGRPPHINRRGAALTKVYHEAVKQLKANESLEQSHADKASPAHTRFFAVDADDRSVRELFTVEWEDDGITVVLKSARSFHKDLTKVFRARIRALLA